jgi:2-(1,2-epoxy-1,2-dihydrophenyl)acetyl-CoA isomerase
MSGAVKLKTMQNELISEFSNGVLRLIMNRPEARNALNDGLCHALLSACERAAVDHGVRAVVLSAAGKSFCAGGDVKAMASNQQPTSTEERAAEMKRFMAASKLLHEMPKPSIALIQGSAAGAGLSLALACDFRLCLPTVKLTTAFSKVGLSGDYGGSFFMQRLVGAAKARELYLLSPLLTGEEALRIGLVTKVFSDESFERESSTFIRHLADGPTVAYGYIKANLNSSYSSSFDDALDREIHGHLFCKRTKDHLEAARAFVEKRPPVFQGE